MDVGTPLDPLLKLLHPAKVICITTRDIERPDRFGLSKALAHASSELCNEGLLFLSVLPTSRKLAQSLATSYGFRVERHYIHFPNIGVSRSIVPADTVALRYFASSISSQRTVAHRAAQMVLPHLPVRMLVAALPNVSLTLRRPGSRAFLSWLADAGGTEHGAPVVIRRSWKPNSGGATLHLLNSSTGEPICVAKLAQTCDESTKLATVAQTVPTNIVVVPEVLAIKTLVEPWRAIIQTPVRGRPLQAEIHRGRITVESFLWLLTDWLVVWHKSTRHIDESRWQRVKEDLVSQARMLLDPGRSARIVEDDCAPPLVAVHNDLTMWNLRLNGQQLGVLDWETSEENGLPLMDFFYAAADAVAARRGYADRLAAMKECFSPDGIYAPVVGKCVKRIARSLELEPACVSLAFCACWVHHAFNEARQTSDGPRPFRNMMNWALSRRDQLHGWIDS